MTNLVINAVETMAYKQGFKSLKFKNRHGVIFHDTDWIAGVDYKDAEDENDPEEVNKNSTQEDDDNQDDEEIDEDYQDGDEDDEELDDKDIDPGDQ